MTGFPWLKLWNEAPDDPKFLAIADIAGSTPGNAFYAWAKSLAYANANDDRGSIAGLHPQVIASFCRIAVEEAKRILEAFRDLGMIVANRIAKWTKRQAESKPRSKGAERTDRRRRNKAAATRQGDLFPHAVEEPANASVTSVTSSVTPNPDESAQTFEKQRGKPDPLESESESDKERIPPNPPKEGGLPKGFPHDRVREAAITEIIVPTRGDTDGRQTGYRRPRRETEPQRRKRIFDERLALARERLAAAQAA